MPLSGNCASSRGAAARRAEKWKAVWMVVLLFAAMGFGTIFLAAGLETVAHAAMAIVNAGARLHRFPEQRCINDADEKASSTGLSRGRQVGGRSSLGVSALLRRERRLL